MTRFFRAVLPLLCLLLALPALAQDDGLKAARKAAASADAALRAAANRSGYVHGFSKNVRDIMEKFRFEEQIARLDGANILFLILRKFVAVDLDPQRLAQARHNAALYGVEGKIRFVEGDFLELAPDLVAAEACFLDPPWEAGQKLALEAWEKGRTLFSRGAMKQPRQEPPPPGANALEAVFGVGAVVSFVLAWWAAPNTRR